MRERENEIHSDLRWGEGKRELSFRVTRGREREEREWKRESYRESVRRNNDAEREREALRGEVLRFRGVPALFRSILFLFFQTRTHRLGQTLLIKARKVVSGQVVNFVKAKHSGSGQVVNFVKAKHSGSGQGVNFVRTKHSSSGRIV